MQPVNFHSPLGHAPAPRIFREEDLPPVKRKLFSDLMPHSLSELYGVDLDAPPTWGSAILFFEQRTIIQQIEETYLSTPAVRQKVVEILKLDDHGRKIAELGMVLFYLDKLGCLPEVESLLSLRAEEMCMHADTYLYDHQKAGADQGIPSGKTQYLLRGFAHMIFTKHQVYNKGGLYAIRELFTDVAFKISKYFQQEHRQHILTVVEQMISQTSFETLFKAKVTVHPSMEEVIRLDLKMAPDEPVHSVHVYYDCVMALFTDIRQVDAPNCYAIGSLIYVTENHPYKVLKNLIEWIKGGYYITKKGEAIPILPLMEKRMVCCYDLDVTLDRKRAHLLTPLRHISQTFDLDPPSSGSGRETLKRTLSEMFKANSSRHIVSYAEKMCYAYKYNTLVHLQLAVIESAFINQSRHKREVIEACVQGIRAKMDLSVSFVNQLKSSLESVLWLENSSATDARVVKGKIEVSERVIGNFKGNLNSLCEVFERASCLFRIEKGEYVPLRTITELQQLLSQAVIEVGKRVKMAGEEWGRKVTNAILSKSFRKSFSYYLSDQINMRGISGRHLDDADLLVMVQEGGVESLAIDLVYGISLHRERIAECGTPYQFLQELLRQLKFYDVSVIQSAPRLLIAARGDHAWTLTPSCWKPLLENKKEFFTFIQEAVFYPAKRRLATVVPAEIVQRVIDRFANTPQLKEVVKQHFAKFPRMSFEKFRSELLANVSSQRYRELCVIIDEEFARISLNKPCFSALLKRLEIVLPSKKYHDLYAELPDEALLPFQWARKIRMSLIECEVAIKDRYEVEIELCKAYGLPLSFNLGDLNWLESYTEDPVHKHLMINYSWALGTPAYFIRDSEKETHDPSFRNPLVEIHHPKVKNPSQKW